jgi:hypothetical protein
MAQRSTLERTRLKELTEADEAEAIVEAIRSAFAGVPRGSITIHEAEVIDSYGSEAERQNARRLDTETDWSRVPDKAIEECTTALSHLDPNGWRYYIPAYMIWSLRYFRVRSSFVSDLTIYTFDPSSGDPRLHAYKLDRFRLLDRAQSRAINWFLRYMAANDDHADSRVAKIVLDELWHEFGDDTDVRPKI